MLVKTLLAYPTLMAFINRIPALVTDLLTSLAVADELASSGRGGDITSPCSAWQSRETQGMGSWLGSPDPAWILQEASEPTNQNPCFPVLLQRQV